MLKEMGTLSNIHLMELATSRRYKNIKAAKIMSEDEILFYKYVMAIKYFDRGYCHVIRNKINDDTKKSLMKLVEWRCDDQCDYFIEICDSPDHMFYVLREKINSMPKNIREKFDIVYPNLVSGLMDLLNDNATTMYQLKKCNIDLDDINRWWDHGRLDFHWISYPIRDS